MAPQNVKGTYKKDGQRILNRACSDRTEGNGFKGGRFILQIRKEFPMMTVVRHWNRLLREAVCAPSLQTLKVRLNGALSNLTSLKASLPTARGVD